MERSTGSRGHAADCKRRGQRGDSFDEWLTKLVEAVFPDALAVERFVMEKLTKTMIAAQIARLEAELRQLREWERDLVEYLGPLPNWTRTK